MFYPEGKYEVRLLKEAAGQTFKKGSLVYYSSGYVAECGNDPSYILGVALQDAHNSSSAGAYRIPVAIASDVATFSAPVTGSGNAAKSAQTDVGTKYGVVALNGDWHVDKDDTSNARVVVIDLIDPAGTTNGRVLVKILSANRYF